MSARSALLAIAGLALGALGSGCAQAILTLDTFRSRQGIDEASLDRLAAYSEESQLTKPNVLTTLGPPTGIVGQDDGEIFLYRRFARDEATLHINPGSLGAGNFPIYHQSQVSGRDDVIMIFFDEDGAVRGIAARDGISNTAGMAASLGEAFKSKLFTEEEEQE